MIAETRFLLHWLAKIGDARPTLRHVLVTSTDGQHGWASCTNGYAFARVPVYLERDDVPGLVSIIHWAEAIRLAEWRQLGALHIQLRAAHVVLDDDRTYARLDPELTEQPFPNLDTLIPDRSQLDSIGPLALNPTLLYELGRALGHDRGMPLFLTYSRATGRVLVETQGPDANGRPEGAHGLLTLMRAYPIDPNPRAAAQADSTPEVAIAS